MLAQAPEIGLGSLVEGGAKESCVEKALIKLELTLVVKESSLWSS